jgi:hypothetical protein
MLIRPFQGSAFRLALLAAACCALPIAAAPQPAVPLTAESAPGAALTLLPSYADLVIWVDYFALRKSDLVAAAESRIDALPDAADNYRRFVQETGLDPRQDTDQVLMSLQQADGAGGAGFLLVAKGRYAASHLVDAAAAKGGTVTTTPKGIKIWTSRGAGGAADNPSGHATIMALAQTDGSTLLFGSEEEVQRAANVAIRAKSPAAQDRRFRELLTGVDRKAPVWAILNSGSLAQRISSSLGSSGGDGGPASVMASVDSVRMMAWVGKDVDLKVEVAAKDAETAAQLGDVFRGMVAAGKLAAKDHDPELVRILQEMTVAESGKEVEVKARIPGSRLRIPETGAPQR